MLAMKFYLLYLLFFFGMMSSPKLVLAQIDHSTQPPLTSQTTQPNHSLPSDHDENVDFTKFPEHGEIPEFGRERPERESDTFQAKFLNMLYILALLILFMIFASWALKRMMRSKMAQINVASNIKLLETRYLSPRATLHLISVQNQDFLIAESPTTVSYLATLSPEKSEEPPTSFKVHH
jgi:flagellar biogenesis protein FliO